jgi:hypothetical protein
MIFGGALLADACHLIGLLAERVGFEPTVPCGTSVFKTDAIDHSTTSPDRSVCRERIY